MQADFGLRRPLLIVLVLLVISMILDRYLVAGLLPWISSLGGVSLMVVFLDIPVAFPLIDPLPVAVLFSLFYSMVPARQGGAPEEGRLRGIWGGILTLACWMAAGAVIYHFAQGYLPKQVRNGIDSFGINADINTPFSEYSVLHLRGGALLLLCFLLGGRPLVKRINRAAAQPVSAAKPSMEEIARPAARTPKRAASAMTSSAREIPVPVEPAKPVRPRAVMKSVPIVAPCRVEMAQNEPPVRSMEQEGPVTARY